MFVGLQSFRLSSSRAKYAWSSTAITTRHGRWCSRVHGWESFILKGNHSYLFLPLMETCPSSRNVMPSATFSSWWKWDTHSIMNLMWSLCLLARGTWVNICHLPTEALMRSVLILSLLLCFVFAGGSPPPRALQTWMTCCGLGHTPDEATALLPHDIYAFGTQENPQGEKEWSEHIKATLRSYTHIDFKQVINL